MPERRPSCRVVGVECVHAIVLSAHEDHIAGSLAGNRNIGNVERLGVNLTVHGARKELTKRIDVDVRGVEDGLAQVRACAIQVVMLSRYRYLGGEGNGGS